MLDRNVSNPAEYEYWWSKALGRREGGMSWQVFCSKISCQSSNKILKNQSCQRRKFAPLKSVVTRVDKSLCLDKTLSAANYAMDSLKLTTVSQQRSLSVWIRLKANVTRFVEIPPLWHIIKNIWQYTYLRFIWFWAKFST